MTDMVWLSCSAGIKQKMKSSFDEGNGRRKCIKIRTVHLLALCTCHSSPCTLPLITSAGLSLVLPCLSSVTSFWWRESNAVFPGLTFTSLILGQSPDRRVTGHGVMSQELSAPVVVTGNLRSRLLRFSEQRTHLADTYMFNRS